jgi:predicted secreted protein
MKANRQSTCHFVKFTHLGFALACLALSSCAVTAHGPANSPAPTAAGDPKPVILAAAAPVAPAETARSLTAADDGKTISLTTATKTLRITLDGNPTTGYSWTLATADGKSVVPVGDVAYIPSAAPAGMAGSGGVFVASFDVKDPGKTTIALEYKRPWEKTPAARTFTVTIDVALPAKP